MIESSHDGIETEVAFVGGYIGIRFYYAEEAFLVGGVRVPATYELVVHCPYTTASSLVHAEVIAEESFIVGLAGMSAVVMIKRDGVNLAPAKVGFLGQNERMAGKEAVRVGGKAAGIVAFDAEVLVDLLFGPWGGNVRRNTCVGGWHFPRKYMDAWPIGVFYVGVATPRVG